MAELIKTELIDLPRLFVVGKARTYAVTKLKNQHEIGEDFGFWTRSGKEA